MQLSQKWNTFSQFVAAFLQSKLNFEYFENMTLADFLFPKLRTPKMYSDKYLKTPISEDPSTSNMVNVSKHYWTVKAIELEKLCLIEMQNRGTAC